MSASARIETEAKAVISVHFSLDDSPPGVSCNDGGPPQLEGCKLDSAVVASGPGPGPGLLVTVR